MPLNVGGSVISKEMGNFYSRLSVAGNYVTDGLVLYLDAGISDSYPGSGTSWFDISGNGNTGTLTNGPTFNSGNGGSIVFDGVDDRVTMNSFTYTPYCLDFWVYNNSIITNSDGAIGGPSTYQTLISFGGGTQGINLGGWTSLATNEALHIWSTSGGARITYTKTSVPVGLHNWVFNWNGTHYDIWVDGSKQTIYAGSTGHALLQSYTNQILLGSDGGTYEFFGKIFTFKLYTSQLTDTQVLQNFNALRNRFGI
jgi:hypothetical protein